MADNLISVKEFSEVNGLRRQSVFKVIKRLGIEPEKSRGGVENRGQTISYITDREARLILDVIGSGKSFSESEDDDSPSLPEAALYDIGVFYFIGLEPEHDPNRFKVGFANNINERLRQHRCSAPFATIVKTWPCRRLWEKTVIECVTDGCEQLHTEVFRSSSLNSVLEKCDTLFELLPKLGRKTD